MWALYALFVYGSGLALLAVISLAIGRVAQAFDLADTTTNRGCPVVAFYARAGTMLPTS